jgi:hypothetical protein
MVVYVLMDMEEGREFPVGVVTDEALANRFYQGDTDNRDVIKFVLDEMPGFTGVPPAPEPQTGEHPMSKAVADATKQIRENTKKMQDALIALRNKKK